MIRSLRTEKTDHSSLPGRLAEIKEEVLSNFFGDQIAASISVGKNTKEHIYGIPNEDAAGYRIFDSIGVAVVADSHFGGLISEKLIEHITLLERDEIKSVLQNENMKHIIDKILAALNELENITDQRIGETTLIVTLFSMDKVYWISLGDSRIYHSGPISKQLNKTSFTFISAYGISQSSFETGIIRPNPGEYIILATDGIPECIYNKETLLPEEIAKFIETTALDTNHSIIEEAFNRGGEDNIGIISIKF